MQLEVGQQISFQGRTWLVFEIERSETTFIASITADEVKASHSLSINVRVLDQHYDDFGPGDIVELLLEVIQLIIPGENIFFIYNKRHYRRIKSATQSSDETTDRAPQGAGVGTAGGARDGGPGADQASGSKDGAGSAGGGGDTVWAGGRQGAEYTSAISGGGDAARDEGEQGASRPESGETVAEILERIRKRSSLGR